MRPPACRVGGAPSAESIARKLAGGEQGGWLAALGALPAAAVGFFPAAFCPACYPALAGLLAALGLGALAGDAILKPLTALLLIVALSGLALQARRSRTYLSLAAGALGAAGMYAGMYVLPSALLKNLGIALLLGASVWNFLPKGLRGSPQAPCPACKAGEAPSRS